MLFLPDQHLGRNTAVLEMGLSLDDCVLYDPHKPDGGLTAEQLRDAKMILWRGHCSVHGRFTLDSVDDVRERVPGVNVLVHPECRHEVVTAADLRRLDRVHHQDDRGGAGRLGVGGRHRAEPGPPARAGAPGQADHVPRQDRLLLLDDEPDRPAAPGVGAGGAGRGPGGQPDHGRPGHRATTPGSALDQMLALPGADTAIDGVLVTTRSALGTQTRRITRFVPLAAM